MEVAVIDISHAAWAFEGRGATLSGCFWAERNLICPSGGRGMEFFAYLFEKMGF